MAHRLSIYGEQDGFLIGRDREANDRRVSWLGGDLFENGPERQCQGAYHCDLGNMLNAHYHQRVSGGDSQPFRLPAEDGDGFNLVLQSQPLPVFSPRCLWYAKVQWWEMDESEGNIPPRCVSAESSWDLVLGRHCFVNSGRIQLSPWEEGLFVEG